MLYNIETLQKMSNWQIESIIAKDLLGWKAAHGHNGYVVTPDGQPSTVPALCTNGDAARQVVQEWCGEDLKRMHYFCKALDDVIWKEGIEELWDSAEKVDSAYIHNLERLRIRTATARDLSMALVLATQGEGE